MLPEGEVGLQAPAFELVKQRSIIKNSEHPSEPHETAHVEFEKTRGVRTSGDGRSRTTTRRIVSQSIRGAG